MKFSHSHLIPLLILTGLFSSSLHASIIFQGGGVDGGLAPADEAGVSFDYQLVDATGYEFVEIESLDMYNFLQWNFSESAVTIVSEMSGGPGTSDIAWVSASWAFQVTDAPVAFRIDASVDLINTRFMKDVGAGHECLSPGCEGDWLYAGTTVGTLLPGYQYIMDFQPAVFGNSSFRFQVVPEPSTILLMATGLAGLGAASRRKKQA
ncbi:MAG: PEP-CTERM sorting domain-containing protein [Candidatus Thiodiazotropha sp.]|jgi:hypothetical protein